MKSDMNAETESPIGRTVICELFERCPQAIDAWDYEKNTVLPEQVSLNSVTVVSWRCKNGHSYHKQVQKFISTLIPCPECRKISASVSGKPHMMKFWDFEKNEGDVTRTSAKSKEYAYWKCPKCGYEWESTIRTRKNDLCPCCDRNSKIMDGVNDFSNVYPQLGLDALQELNPNIDLKKEGVGSHKRITWKCHVCGYQWKAPIYGRIRRDTSEYYIAKCPVCIKNKRSVPFVVDFPELKNLYSSKNAKPLSDITSYGEEKYIWTCKKHGEFTATLRSMLRSISQKNNGCPYCHGTKVKREESFGAIHPELLPEWAPQNKLSPFGVKENSKKKVEWVCSKGHTWVASVYVRSNGYGYCRECFPFGKTLNSFSDIYPELRKHYSKKNTKPFDDHFQREKEYAIWNCDNDHEFRDTFYYIDRRGFQCPICTGRKILTGFNDFMTLYPEYAKDYDEEKNKLPVRKIPPRNSNMKTFWLCKEGHSFQRSVKAHIKCKGDCPVCSRKVLVYGVNDLLTAYPRIADIWDYIRNGRGPENVFDTSSDYYYFACDCGHCFSAKIQQVAEGNFCCLVCNDTKFLAEANSLAVLKPELAKEWSPSNSRGADMVRPTIRMSARWICSDCGGEYSAIIRDREVGDQSCPICANRKLSCGINDLKTTHPDLAFEWSPNNDRGPDTVIHSYAMTSKWICPTCHGEYSARIVDREVGDDACPHCSRGELLTGFNDLATTHKNLASEWSPNNDRGPETVCHSYVMTSKWICPTCRGEYSARIVDREVGDDACPYCSDRSTLSGYNDLATTDPLLATEWSHNNNREVYAVRKNQKYLALWICPTCHGEYSDWIVNREVGNDACPYCSDRLTLSGYNDLATTDPLLAAEWSHNNIRSVLEVRKNQSLNALWICSTCHGEYSARIDNREVGDDACPYCSDRLTLSGYNDLATTDPLLAAEWSHNNIKSVLEVRKNQSLNTLWICPTCHGEYSARIADREVGDDACLYCSDRLTLSGYNDLATTDPLLAAEWSHNNIRSVLEVRKNQSLNALWICLTCHGEYSARIADREVGDDACPYCSDRLTLSGYNDLVTKDPLLAAEWSRNNNQTPNKVRKNQSLVALWICPTCNGEYSARIADREVGDDACLYCSDRKILPGLNSFKACHEDLMSEWLKAENNLLGIDPDMASDTDRRNVWWKCEVCGRKYTLSINDRLLKQKRGHSSCTYCNGRRIKLIHFV